jgi:hypothetical protein
MAKQEDLITLSLKEKLSRIQVEFKANKSRWNSFGKYNFRSAEDILEGLKPFNDKYGVFFVIVENLELDTGIGFPIIRTVAVIEDVNSGETIKASAIVGVDLVQKGMQTPQAFGSASSYGKKYALGNLLLIDDTQDSDATNTHGNDTTKKSYTKPKIDVGTENYEKAVTFIKNGGDVNIIYEKYNVSEEAKKQLSNL